MKLELRKFQVDEINFGDSNKLEGKILTINKDVIIKRLLEMPYITDVKIDLAKPGDKTRIIPVKDCIQPRYKVEGTPGFSGLTSEVGQLGEGVVNIMENVSIVTIGDIVGFQEGIVDMWGEGAKWTPFSKTMNIVIDISVEDGINPHDHEAAVREAGLLSSEIVGEALKDLTCENIELFNMGNNVEETNKYPNLPKVVYVEMLITQGLLHDSYLYGVNCSQLLPTLIHPNEELDGAVVSGNCVAACDKITTFQHQNNSVIKDLYERHGKDINFLGVVVTPELTTLAGKFRSSDYVAKLCNQLGADGVIVSEEGYGNPDSDLVMICSKLDKLGIKTVLITDECSGWDGVSQPLADTNAAAIAVVSTGNVSHVVHLEKPDKILGDVEAIQNVAGGWDGCYDPETGTITCELNAVIGATSEIGFFNCTIDER